MHLATHLISDANTRTALYLADVDRQALRERSMVAMQRIALNDLQQCDPQTCNAFAEYCTERISPETTLALCLARIHRDTKLQALAVADWNREVDALQNSFIPVEVERRIAAAKADAEARAESFAELRHA